MKNTMKPASNVGRYNYEWPNGGFGIGEGEPGPTIACEACHDGGTPPYDAGPDEEEWCPNCPVDLIRQIRKTSVNGRRYPLHSWTDNGNAQRVIEHMSDRLQTNGALIWRVKIGNNWHYDRGSTLAGGVAVRALSEIIMEEVRGCGPEAVRAAAEWRRKTESLSRGKRAVLIAQPYLDGLR